MRPSVGEHNPRPGLTIIKSSVVPLWICIRAQLDPLAIYQALELAKILTIDLPVYSSNWTTIDADWPTLTTLSARRVRSDWRSWSLKWWGSVYQVFVFAFITLVIVVGSYLSLYCRWFENRWKNLTDTIGQLSTLISKDNGWKREDPWVKNSLFFTHSQSIRGKEEKGHQDLLKRNCWPS